MSAKKWVFARSIIGAIIILLSDASAWLLIPLVVWHEYSIYKIDVEDDI